MVNAGVGYTTVQLVDETIIRLSGEYVDPWPSSMNTNINSYTSRLTNAMHLVKLVSTQL